MECRKVFWRINYWLALAVTLATSLASDGAHLRNSAGASPTQQEDVYATVRHIATGVTDAEFIGPIANVTVAKGRDAVLSCSLSHSNNHSVGWLRTNSSADGTRLVVNTVLAMGTNIVIHDARFGVESPDDAGSPVWKLNIKNVRPEDAGWYMAQISNTDPIKSQAAYLTVLEPPDIDDAATPSQYTVNEGDPVEMHCRASGVPAPLITWRREDGVLVANDTCRGDNQQHEGHGRLCLSSVDRTSSGSYLCIASNGIAPATSKRIQLFVSFSPVVKTDKSVTGAHAGAEFISMDCTIESSPALNYFWYKDENAITPASQRYEITEYKINSYTVIATLVIHKVQSDDAGLYRCQAGDQETTIRFYVFHPTEMPTTTTTITPAPAMKRTKTEATYYRAQQTFAVTKDFFTAGSSTRLPIQDLIYRNHVAPERALSARSAAFHVSNARVVWLSALFLLSVNTCCT